MQPFSQVAIQITNNHTDDQWKQYRYKSHRGEHAIGEAHRTEDRECNHGKKRSVAEREEWISSLVILFAVLSGQGDVQSAVGIRHRSNNGKRCQTKE
ncbi:hypothetical protein D3C76_1360710 [compost metagenome]